MNAIERRAQALRCTSVDDAKGSLFHMPFNQENIAIVKLVLTQCEYQGFQITKERMFRGWLKRAAKAKEVKS